MNSVIADLKMLASIALYLCCLYLMSLGVIWLIFWAFHLFYITLP